MRTSIRFALTLSALLVAACDQPTQITGGGGSPLPAPQDLSYELDPSGSPGAPSGILLTWQPVASAGLSTYRVYSTPTVGGAFNLRAETTSPSYHDAGMPDVQYMVTAIDVNGNESTNSNVVTVDSRLTLDPPDSLFSTSLNGAIALDWTDNAYLSNRAAFKWYRVYSSSAISDTLCDTDWVLEGATVSPDFIVSALTNGVSRCYVVSAIDTLGDESMWSPIREDTPRPDARNVALFPVQANAASAGLEFWDGTASGFGLVVNGGSASANFFVTQHADSTLWLTPVAASGTTMQQYGIGPLDDLTSIDYAPASGYSSTSLQALPGDGYVFQIVNGATVRYGAVRVTHVGRDFLILDWSFQTAAGNPELIRAAGQTVAVSSGRTILRH
jgi:hypothetical protein